MIEGLKPYVEYKESDVPWFGMIPSHWSLKRLGSIFIERGETNERREVSYVLSLLKDRGVIPYAEKGRIGNKASEDIGRYNIVRPDDLVMNCMNVIIGSVGRSNFTGCLSPVYYVLVRRRQEENPRFLEHLFLHKPFHQSLVRIGNGILAHRMRIPMEKLKSEMLPLPPPDEQAAIVKFLDYANGKIERAIRAKRKLIGLLNEQKQAIIHTAISAVSTQDCRMMPVRAVLHPVKRMGHPNETLLSLFRDYGVIPKDSRENKNVDVRDLALCQLVNPGDVVMNKMKAWQGSIAVSDLQGIVSPDYMVLEFQIKPIVKEFFHYALRSPSMVANYRKQAYGVRPGQWRLMYPDFCRLRLPVPTIEKQLSTVQQIKSDTQSIYTAIARSEREIALLREYRTTLTAEVVTGKLDVREATKRLPDQADEPLPFDDSIDELIEDEIDQEDDA